MYNALLRDYKWKKINSASENSSFSQSSFFRPTLYGLLFRFTPRRVKLSRPSSRKIRSWAQSPSTSVWTLPVVRALRFRSTSLASRMAKILRTSRLSLLKLFVTVLTSTVFLNRRFLRLATTALSLNWLVWMTLRQSRSWVLRQSLNSRFSLNLKSLRRL